MRKSIHMLGLYLSVLFIYILGFVVVDVLFYLNSDTLVALAVDEYIKKNP